MRLESTTFFSDQQQRSKAKLTPRYLSEIQQKQRRHRKEQKNTKYDTFASLRVYYEIWCFYDWNTGIKITNLCIFWKTCFF